MVTLKKNLNPVAQTLGDPMLFDRRQMLSLTLGGLAALTAQGLSPFFRTIISGLLSTQPTEDGDFKRKLDNRRVSELREEYNSAIQRSKLRSEDEFPPYSSQRMGRIGRWGIFIPS